MKYVALFLSSLLIMSCGFSGSGTSKEYENAVTRAVDMDQYIDLTSSMANANTVSKSDFLYIVEGEYINGDSYIKVNANRGFIELYNPHATIIGFGTGEFKTQFSFSVFPASKQCLYIKQANTSSLIIEFNGKEYSGVSLGDLLTCIPLHGYGAGRIEVSSIMNGFIAMPSGTYWKK